MRQDGGDGGGGDGGQIFHFNCRQDAESEAEPVAEGNATEVLPQVGRVRSERLQGEGDKYSHRVGASAAVALLADDGCAEMLGVGEREPVERLRRMQTTAASARERKAEHWRYEAKMMGGGGPAIPARDGPPLTSLSAKWRAPFRQREERLRVFSSPSSNTADMRGEASGCCNQARSVK